MSIGPQVTVAKSLGMTERQICRPWVGRARACRWQPSLQHAMLGGESIGLGADIAPEMERQGSRMQVDEDSKNVRYQTDTFRMLGYKVVPCCKRFKHHWNSCPFLHPNERAKRRDPRLYHYESTMCPAVKNSDDKRKLSCPQKDQCRFAHNVFEEYLHPDRYRTVMCKDYPRCNRDVCFFAHTQDEIRRVDQAWSWNQLARDNFQHTPLSAFLQATGGLKVSPVAAAIARLFYSGRIEEAKRSVADSVSKMFRECWKLDNPEAAVLIEALALQAELPLPLQPDVEESVRCIRQNGPRRTAARETLAVNGFLQDRLAQGMGLGFADDRQGLYQGNAAMQWTGQPASGSQQDNLYAQMNLLSSLGLASPSDQGQLSPLTQNFGQEMNNLGSMMQGHGNTASLNQESLTNQSFAGGGFLSSNMRPHAGRSGEQQTIQQLLAALDHGTQQTAAASEAAGIPLQTLQALMIPGSSNVHRPEDVQLGLQAGERMNSLLPPLRMPNDVPLDPRLQAAEGFQLPLDLEQQASGSHPGFEGMSPNNRWGQLHEAPSMDLLSSSMHDQARMESEQRSDQLALNAAFDQLNIRRDG